MSMIAILAAFYLNRDTPEKAIKRYFQALERRDAVTAIDQSVPVAHRALLTNAVLKHSEAQGGGVSLVSVHGYQVVYQVGKTQVQTRMATRKLDGQYRVIVPAATMPTENLLIPASIGDTVVNPGEKTVLLFPGRYQVVSTSELVTISPSVVTVLEPQKPVVFTPEFEVSAKGTDDIRSLVRSSLAECLKSTQLATPGCPWAFAPPPNAVLEPGTLKFTVVDDVATARMNIDKQVVRVPLQLTVQVQATTKVGSTAVPYTASMPVTTIAQVPIVGERTLTWSAP